MFSYDSAWKRAWGLLILLLIFFSAVEIPLWLVLDYHPVGNLLIFHQAISYFFLLDVVLNFRTSIHVGGKTITSGSEVARHYLRTWFLVDFLSAIPMELILGFEDPLFGSVLRLLRLLRVKQLLSQQRLFTSLNPTILRLAVFISWVLLAAHWISCIWISLGGCAEETDILRRYLRSMYWAFATLGTVGYGDITPVTNMQTIYAIFVMILGAGMYGYIIGNVASLLANMDVAKVQFSEKMDKINAFLSYRNIPIELQEKVHGYYNYIWESRQGYDESVVIEGLPPSLKTEISLFLNREIIQKVPLFHGAGSDLVRDIVLSMQPVVFMPGDKIVQKGELGDTMFFISHGRVEVISEDGAEVYATLNEGNFFGEIALLTMEPRTATIRAADYCDLYVLHKKVFDRVLEKYPEFSENIRLQAEKRRQTRDH